MADETFRLPKSSYDELVKIIQAYGNSGSEASLDEVARSAVMDKTIISRNNAFLVSVGIIEGGKAKGITEKGRRLSTALQHQLPNEISEHWREIVTTNDFLQKMLAAVSIRQGMEDSALQSHIAYSAGEGKNPNVMAGSGAVVEILKTAGLLKEQDGKLVANPSAIQSMSSVSLRGTVQEQEKPPIVREEQRMLVAQAFPPGISIQIQIQCTANEVESLAPKLKALLKELVEKEEPESEGKN